RRSPLGIGRRPRRRGISIRAARRRRVRRASSRLAFSPFRLNALWVDCRGLRALQTKVWGPQTNEIGASTSVRWRVLPCWTYFGFVGTQRQPGFLTQDATMPMVQAHAQLLAPHELSPTPSLGQRGALRWPRSGRHADGGLALYRPVLAVE